MMTTIDKAIAGGIVSFIANWLLAHYHVALPADLQVALSGLIVAVIVWVTPNIETALDKAQGIQPAATPPKP